MSTCSEFSPAISLGSLGPLPASQAHGQVIVMGMSRSGTSLTTSIIAKLLGHEPNCWHGSAKPYPTDKSNPRGYYEHSGVVSLNYQVLGQMGVRWTTFAPGETQKVLRFENTSRGEVIRQYFDAKAKGIINDMETYSPWVLKDVRLARTLPLWWKHLSSPICIIPYRHPYEVAASSIFHSTTVWDGYIRSALTAARHFQCPTMLVAYRDWIDPHRAKKQLHELHRFLKCAGVRGLSDTPRHSVLEGLVHPEDNNHTDASKKALTPQLQCTYNALTTGAAHGPEETWPPPCNAHAAPTAKPPGAIGSASGALREALINMRPPF